MSSTRDYIAQHKEVWIEQMIETGVPASITAVQGIIESANGERVPGGNSNNQFGITAGSEWEKLGGKSVMASDNGNQRKFRAYASVADSFLDHAALLRISYSKCFDLDPLDYRGWAKGLKAGGYAEDPSYSQILINNVEHLNLHELDKEA